jgi:hypothetical protein
MITDKLQKLLNEELEPITHQGLALLTWNEIRDAYDKKYGKNNHHLRLECKCGNTMTCRCMSKKVTEYGICPECAENMTSKDAEDHIPA